MEWKAFAYKIGALYHEETKRFFGGDKVCKSINKEVRSGQLTMRKISRRTFTLSSRNRVERFEIELRCEMSGFGSVRIHRKSFLGRIGKYHENQYLIKGRFSKPLDEILKLEELNYLLSFPNSDFSVLENLIKFKSQFSGEINEDLEKMFNSFEALTKELIG